MDIRLTGLFATAKKSITGVGYNLARGSL